MQLNSIKPNFLRVSLFFSIAFVWLGITPCDINGQSQKYAYGVIKGSVVDQYGKPLAGAAVSLLREGANEAAKEVRSAADGSFVAKVSPGRYVISAIAAGFGSFAFPAVQVNRSAELVYRFNLTPDSSGKTRAAKRADRDSSKWVLRNSQNRRSIFQVDKDSNEKVSIAVGETTAETENEQSIEEIKETEPIAQFPNQPKRRHRTRGVVETYFSSPSNPRLSGYVGTNFAIARNVSDRVELIFAGQTGLNSFAPQRFETTARWRATDRHTLSVNIGGMRVGKIDRDETGTNAVFGKSLDQVSLRSIDEWIVRDGVVVVLGVDYSRFIGAGNASSFSPRFGLQFDANAQTRVKFAYAPGGTENETQSVAISEGGDVLFKQPVTEPVALVDGQAVIEKSRRLEFGVERVLSGRSSIEATAFFDTTSGRGVGLLSQPLNAFSETNGEALLKIANQQGSARGFRIVYSHRISDHLSASAGYSFGRGQELSPDGIMASPTALFKNGFFQTAAAQLFADFDTGTQIRTVFRFSPDATVFAIDPFAGRLAVFDPSLSILVTQELPKFGLPFRAVAVLDARNLLDSEVVTDDSETRLLINSNRRLVKGGISVRF